jgi:hypothetical protein
MVAFETVNANRRRHGNWPFLIFSISENNRARLDGYLTCPYEVTPLPKGSNVFSESGCGSRVDRGA